MWRSFSACRRLDQETNNGLPVNRCLELLCWNFCMYVHNYTTSSSVSSTHLTQPSSTTTISVTTTSFASSTAITTCTVPPVAALPVLRPPPVAAPLIPPCCLAPPPRALWQPQHGCLREPPAPPTAQACAHTPCYIYRPYNHPHRVCLYSLATSYPMVSRIDLCS